MDKKDAVEIVKNYAEVVKNRLSVKKVILYGSHAKQSAMEYSDIDVSGFLDEITKTGEVVYSAD